MNLNLAAQPGHQNTYHWDGLASSDTSTNCDDPISNSSVESLCMGLYGSDKFVIGSDGSISDTNMVFAHTGDETLSYVYKPNCDTTCPSGQSNPIATWQVTVHVQ